LRDVALIGTGEIDTIDNIFHLDPAGTSCNGKERVLTFVVGLLLQKVFFCDHVVDWDHVELFRVSIVGKWHGANLETGNVEVCRSIIVNLKIRCSFRHQKLLFLDQSLVNIDDSDGAFVPASWFDWLRVDFDYLDLS
jgi:hypothetical protein